jgi:hypothetical protein
MAQWRKVVVSGSSPEFSGVTLSGDLTVSGGDIVLGSTSIFSGGDTAQLNNIDALDATTEATIESAIDTLSNLTAASSLVTVSTLASGAISSGFGNIDIGTSTLNAGNSTVDTFSNDSAVGSSNITGSFTGSFTIDGSNLTGVAQDIELLNAYGAATLHQTQDKFLVSDNGTEKSITFSNLEDSIFANVSGDATVAAGGALTIAATSVEGSMLNDNVISGQGALGSAAVAQADLLLIDDGPGTIKSVTFSNFEDSIFGNVSGDIAIAAGGAATVTGASTNAALTAGVGLSTTNGTFNGASAVTFALDLSELSDVQIASGDKLAVLDSDGANEQLESIDDVATLFAGDGLQAASAVMAVDVSDFAGTGLEDDSSENLRLASQGTGISGGAGSTLSITAAQTAITSVYNTALKVGRGASDTYITFAADDNIDFYAGATKIIDLTTSGVDVTGALTVSSNATIEGNLVVNGDTTTLSTTNLQVGDAFIFAATGSAASNVDGGLIVQEGAAVDSGSALYHDTNDNRWSVAKSIAATATAVTPLQHVVTVSGSVSTNPNSTSGSYGIGEMWITDAEDIWVRTA